MLDKDTIVALATPLGRSAVGIIRLSGKEALNITNKVFYPKKHLKKLDIQPSHTLHLGEIFDDDHMIDEVLVSLFKSPNSYTGEELVEFSCHGAPYILQRILQLLIKHGARMAKAGEFTLRAFINGKMDLSQAEALADLITSESEAAHTLAIQQIRGGVSNQIRNLRSKLVNFASLLELSLDFSEEDIEVVDHSKLLALLSLIKQHFNILIDSFSLGNAIKKGIPVVIVGPPNSGKSTLLNTLLKEERAIVSDIPGTTRDVIHEQIIIDGISFRFLDTAGIRQTNDNIEALGIEKTFECIRNSSVIFYIYDAFSFEKENVLKQINTVEKHGKHLFILENKSDLCKKNRNLFQKKILHISAKKGYGISKLLDELLNVVNNESSQTPILLTQIRHYEALKKALVAIDRVQYGIEKKYHLELLAADLNQALYYMGEISGEVSSYEVLENIFSNFCIGK